MPVIKEYIVTFPDGREKLVVNLNRFCRENGLNSGNMSQIALGNGRSCKGYACRPSDMSKREWESRNRKGFKQGNSPFVKWRIMTPAGETVKTCNLLAFSKENGLNYRSLIGVANGLMEQHRGYKCSRHHDRRKNVESHTSGNQRV